MSDNIPNMVIGISFSRERSRMYDIISTMNDLMIKLGGDEQYSNPINGISEIYTWLFQNIDKLSKGESINQESYDETVWPMSRIISKVFALQICVYANLFERESKLMVMTLFQDAIDHWIDKINVNENLVFIGIPQFDGDGNLFFHTPNRNV